MPQYSEIVRSLLIKRGVVDDSEVEALEKINEITRYLDMEKDAKTYLTEFWFVPYAEPTKHRQLDIREISNKLGE